MKTRSSIAACLLPALFFTASGAALAENLPADSPKALTDAVSRAKPGDVITLEPGEYRMGRVRVRNAGSAASPITVTARLPARTRLRYGGTELFNVQAPHWRFENLDIDGGKTGHHAFHVVGGAHGFTLRNSRLRNYHAAVKANPERGVAPDDVVIEGNVFTNDAPRETGAPVTPIDAVGGDRWIVRGNFIADFAKAGGNRIAYGAFLKGGGRNGIFERNLVMCEWKHRGGDRVGLSFGGGGSNPCTVGVCPLEHAGGIMRNNIIVNCPRAPGIYINRAQDVNIRHNTIYNAWGIELRFAGTVAIIRNNLMSGAVTTRQGASAVSDGNIEAGYALSAYTPGAARKLKERIDDYDRKFDFLDRGDIDWLQNGIDGLAAWWSDSMFGRNDDKLADWFREPADADLILRRGASPDALDTGLAEARPSHDFCGRARGKGVYVGAIDYGAPPCDVPAWRRALIDRFSKTE